MALEEWRVVPCPRSEVKDFTESWHYSKSINGIKIAQCFKLVNPDGYLCGVALYGAAATTAWKKYAEVESDCLELRRLVCVDDTPKNAESFLVGQSLRWLRKNTDFKVVISYADPNHGHSGMIYRASNFKHVGMTAGGIVFDWNGKIYHDRALRTKYNGKLKPFAIRLAEAVKSGEAVTKVQTGKHIYVYDLRR
jgi:hypothetical protein